MSINLLEKIQQNLGYPPLHKVDPNMHHDIPDKAAQCTLTGVLTGFYRYVQTDEGAEQVLRGYNSTNWADEIFEDHSNEVVNTIADCSGNSPHDTKENINAVAREVVRATKEVLPANATIKDVKSFFTSQRNTILTYLPPSLHMGDWLHDTALDDMTNKMEGPISNLIKNIGSAFSKPVTDEEVKQHH
ncbi:hypothetical protein [Ferruginibacter sp.]